VLRDDILAGRLSPGDRLTEATVMERTGVSRTPVREGLRRLEGEGLVVAYRGRGTYVTYRLSPEEASLVYDCRMVLEPYLTRVAAQRATDEALAGVRAVLDRFRAAIDASPREAGRADADFHLAIYETSASELTSVLRGYWSRVQLELSERVYTTELPRAFAREHEGIYEAMERRDGPLAEERMRNHIQHGRHALERALRSAEARKG
jgi:DNA-binding GntR family transcriptional regulator